MSTMSIVLIVIGVLVALILGRLFYLRISEKKRNKELFEMRWRARQGCGGGEHGAVD